MQLENKRRGRQRADGNRLIAPLKTPQGVATYKQAFRHVACGDAAFAPRKREVAAQLEERLSRREWNGACFQYGDTVL